MAKNELVQMDLSQLPSTQVGSNEMYDDLAKSAEFLARLQLFTKGKAIDKGLVPPGNYGVPESAEDITVLGPKIDLLVLARRPKAIDMSDKEAIIVTHDNESAEFKRIANQSLEKESNCMYGPSFLVFERSSGRFLEFFCGTKSTRGEAKKLYAYLPLSQSDIDARGLTDQEPHGPLPVTLSSKLVEKGSFSWHVPVVTKCSLAFTNLPAMAKTAAEMVKFVSPQEDTIERVPETAAVKGGKKARTR